MIYRLRWIPPLALALAVHAWILLQSNAPPAPVATPLAPLRLSVDLLPATKPAPLPPRPPIAAASPSDPVAPLPINPEPLSSRKPSPPSAPLRQVRRPQQAVPELPAVVADRQAAADVDEAMPDLSSPPESPAEAVAVPAQKAKVSAATPNPPPPSYRPPRLVRGGNPNSPPAYPRSLRRRGVEGQVLLRAEVNVDGRCERVDVVESSGHRPFDQAALDAVRLWRFVPAMRGDRPVPGGVEVPIVFRLTDG